MPRGEHNSAKTHCRQGHEFTAENTLIVKTATGTPARQCKACNAERLRKRVANQPGIDSARTMQWRRENSERFNEVRKARDAVKYAVRVGKLSKPNSCQKCGYIPRFGKLEAHHHQGYARECWLDVVWLCPKCHKKAEGETK